MRLEPKDRSDIIAEFMELKFGKLLNWERPKLKHLYGANDLDLVEKFERDRTEVIDQVHDTIEKKSDDILIAFRSEELGKLQFLQSELGPVLSERITRLHQSVPPPVAYGYGHPSFAARFDHWSRMPKLSLLEVSLLSLGADPKNIEEDKWVELRKTVEKGKMLYAAHTAYIEQREIFSRCFHFTGFGYAAEDIETIKYWIEKMGIQVHPTFYEGLKVRTISRGTEIPETISPNSELLSNGLSSQETQTLFKMIAAMAVKGYTFDPKAKRNQATADLKSDLDLLGISLDEKTILKWLRRACETLPTDITDKNL